jgi:hypothetical protein
MKHKEALEKYRELRDKPGIDGALFNQYNQVVQHLYNSTDLHTARLYVARTMLETPGEVYNEFQANTCNPDEIKAVYSKLNHLYKTQGIIPGADPVHFPEVEAVGYALFLCRESKYAPVIQAKLEAQYDKLQRGYDIKDWEYRSDLLDWYKTVIDTVEECY